MRLRKNMKRTAAAVLALSMAVSAVAAPASAAYICDVSRGNVDAVMDGDLDGFIFAYLKAASRGELQDT